jgi:hypothetical protein
MQPRSAARIEHAGRAGRGDEGRFPVHLVTLRCQRMESPLVVLAVPGHGA